MIAIKNNSSTKIKKLEKKERMWYINYISYMLDIYVK